MVGDDYRAPRARRELADATLSAVTNRHLQRARPWPAGHGRRRLLALTATGILAVGALSGCEDDATQAQSHPAQTGATIEPDGDGFDGTLVDPPLRIAPVTLRDTAGQPVGLHQVAPGKAKAVFFGFTNCDDICPTTMADLAAARRSLPTELADRVALVFITVDPDRDSAPVLRTWLDQFDADIIGLRGPVERVHQAERSLYSTQSGKEPASVSASPSASASGHAGAGDHTDDGGRDHTGPDAVHGYEVGHSSVIYLFGPDGSTVIYTGNATPAAYEHDLTRLLKND